MRSLIHAWLGLAIVGSTGCDPSSTPPDGSAPAANTEAGDASGPEASETASDPADAGDDPSGGTTGDAEGGDSTSAGPPGPETTTGNDETGEAASAGETGDQTGGQSDAAGESSSGGQTPVVDEDLIFTETFEGGLANVWPPAWQPLGGLVSHGVDDLGRGWLNSFGYTVGRLFLPGYAETNVDMAATVTFGHWNSQGVGLYARQNGGYLTQSDPPGAGYVAYLEGGYLNSLGIWREHEGIEEPLHQELLAAPLLDGVPYRLRFQCEQVGPVTQLRARVWPAAEVEPTGWDVEITDDTPTLQDTAGSFAVDLFNYVNPVAAFVDDIEIRVLP